MEEMGGEPQEAPWEMENSRKGREATKERNVCMWEWVGDLGGWTLGWGTGDRERVLRRE